MDPSSNRSSSCGRVFAVHAVVDLLALVSDELDVRTGVYFASPAARVGSLCEGLCFVVRFLHGLAAHDFMECFARTGCGRGFISCLSGCDFFAWDDSAGRRHVVFAFVHLGVWPAESRVGPVRTLGAIVLVARVRPFSISILGGSVATRFCLFLSLIFGAQSISLDWLPALTVWNVGQGQWVTLSDESGCRHFDTGGEFAPWPAIMALCRRRANFVWLSHWDWDHISFAGGVRRNLPDTCFLGRPLGSANVRKQRALIDSIDCSRKINFASWAGEREGKANERSRVALVYGVLIPGDSTSVQEKRWVRELEGVKRARILILGHHGSRTSTSKILSANIPNVRMAIASARFRRYGHPHREVEARMRARKIPVLRTEDWGTIRIEL